MPNKGTKGEIQCVNHLFQHRNDSPWCEKRFDCPYIELLDPKTKEEIQSPEDIKKTGPDYKADIVVRKSTGELIFPSIKTTNCAPPAILNHTHRNAKVFQKKYVEDLPTMDKIIKFYLEKRKAGEYGEDVYLHDLFKDFNCGDKEQRVWAKLFIYFIFSGTGKGDAICPADSILEWDGNDIKLIICKTQEQKEHYLESLLSQDLYRIKMCIRAPPKGMPKHNEQHVPWIFKDHKDDGKVKIKGALHIRIEKIKN